MADMAMRLLFDQNVPVICACWLREKKSEWNIVHVNEIGFKGKADSFLYSWAQKNETIIITYDEDFADSRMYPLGAHKGIIRLRVWPTTIEQTQKALEFLLERVSTDQWHNSLIIIDNNKIRIRKII
jgi:predicted nuclease of predicted toxin-antitoxin system